MTFEPLTEETATASRWLCRPFPLYIFCFARIFFTLPPFPAFIFSALSAFFYFAALSLFYVFCFVHGGFFCGLWVFHCYEFLVDNNVDNAAESNEVAMSLLIKFPTKMMKCQWEWSAILDDDDGDDDDDKKTTTMIVRMIMNDDENDLCQLHRADVNLAGSFLRFTWNLLPPTSPPSLTPALQRWWWWLWWWWWCR